MPPEPTTDSDHLTRTAFLRAMVELFREESALLPPDVEIPVILAGGAAVHYWTQANVTHDIDAEFGKRFFPSSINMPFTDEEGQPRCVELDMNYAPVFAILHEDYQEDAVEIGRIGAFRLRVMTPLDLAVSKLTRWQDHDRRDVRLLAEHRLIDAADLELRAREAAVGAIGNLRAFFLSLDEAIDLVHRAQGHAPEP